MSILKLVRRGLGSLSSLRISAWLEPNAEADALKEQELGEANSARTAHSQREDRRLAALMADDKLAREHVSRRAATAKTADSSSPASARGVASSASQPAAAPKGSQAVEPLVVLDMPAAGASQSQAKGRSR